MAGFGSDVWRSLGGAGSGLFVSVPVWESGLAARGHWVFGNLSPRGVPSGVWRVHFDTHAEPDCGRCNWLAAALILWILNWTTSFGNSVTVQVLNYLSVVSHLDSFTRAVIDSKDLIYYLTMIFLGLFLTARSLESLRWRA